MVIYKPSSLLLLLQLLLLELVLLMLRIYDVVRLHVSTGYILEPCF
jgi:hypothetical protein